MRRNTFRHFLNLGDTRLDRFKSGCHLQAKPAVERLRVFVLHSSEKGADLCEIGSLGVQYDYPNFCLRNNTSATRNVINSQAGNASHTPVWPNSLNRMNMAGSRTNS